MEETKKVKEPTMAELREQLLKSREEYMNLFNTAKQKIESLNYENAFRQQGFMLEIIKNKDYFNDTEMGQNIVNKALESIYTFWFEENNDEKQS